MDIVQDRTRSTLWVVGADGSDHRPLTTGNRNDASPRWSPGGRRLAYVSADESPGRRGLAKTADAGRLRSRGAQPASAREFDRDEFHM
jgi:Tol biopolymer transport system component